MTANPPGAQALRGRIVDHLRVLYGATHSATRLDALADDVLAAFAGPAPAPPARADPVPSPLRADETVLITYADTIVEPQVPHLRTLARFCETHLADTFSTVHVLPFFPSSGDGGFSVVDFRSVAEGLGEWSDLAAMPFAELMVDLVCNHGSVHSDWFANFVAGAGTGHDYFMTADPTADLSMVVRPRTHPLLLAVETSRGLRHVWTTFSHDQVDFDFSNPDVLVEFCSVLGLYLANGATRVRLDAIAYLWKRLGTPCIHLPETHEVVKLMRSLMAWRYPASLLITETNVPHADNVAYFGAGDEAHVVYNFTLSPLIISALLTERADTLSDWLERLDPPPSGCAFLNFLASHDGVGLRPVEGLLASDELGALIDRAVESGGAVSAYGSPAGPRPYELNVSLADLLAGRDGATADRYVLAHALLLAIQGIPAIYIHSLLVSPGDLETVRETGHNRDINRARIDRSQATERISAGWRGQTFAALTALLRLRRATPRLGPESRQVVHHLHPSVVAIERGPAGNSILALHNVSGHEVDCPLPIESGRFDLLAREPVDDPCRLAPWQARWLRDAE